MTLLRLAPVSLIVGAVMFMMLSERAEGSWLLAAVWAATIHWASGFLIIALAGMLPPALPDAWLRMRPWEADGRVYQRLGIDAYRKALLASPSGPNAFLKFQGRRSQIPGLEQFTKNAEMGHLTLLVVSTVVTAIAVWTGYWRTAIFLAIVNVPWNVYPVLLQRYTRSRLILIRRRLSNQSPALASR
jgi:heme/copper-type cytochrome/quinol oxidase subunit 4